VAYQELAGESKVPPLICPMDQVMLMPNLTLDDELYLYCLDCGYKNFVGLELYDKLVKYLEKHGMA
jgi:hypothetical protein